MMVAGIPRHSVLAMRATPIADDSDVVEDFARRSSAGTAQPFWFVNCAAISSGVSGRL